VTEPVSGFGVGDGPPKRVSKPAIPWRTHANPILCCSPGRHAAGTVNFAQGRGKSSGITPNHRVPGKLGAWCLFPLPSKRQTSSNEAQETEAVRR
jgi:hypothetical protein